MPRLLRQLHNAIRSRQMSPRTEETYAGWIKRYVRYHGLRHPSEMAEPEVQAFLTHLAVDRDVAASTQTQALSALLFLYAAVLDAPLNELEIVRVRKPRRIPTVLSHQEVAALIHELTASLVSSQACSTELASGFAARFAFA